MAEKLLVLAASRYDFTSDDGKRLRGAKIFTVEGTSHKSPDKVGSMPAEMSADIEVFEDVQGHTLPAYFDVDLAVTGGAKGKIGVKVAKLVFLHGLDAKPSPVRAAA
jgi:hypothetical protein